MKCERCGSEKLDKQGYLIVGKDRENEVLNKYLDVKIYTCLKCKSTLSYKEA